MIKGHIMLMKTCTPSSVLLVCLGNICRSPTAEEIFRQQAAIAGLSMKVDSAGTGDWHIGHAPDERAHREGAGGAAAGGEDGGRVRAAGADGRSERRRAARVAAVRSGAAGNDDLRPRCAGGR